MKKKEKYFIPYLEQCYKETQEMYGTLNNPILATADWTFYKTNGLCSVFSRMPTPDIAWEIFDLVCPTVDDLNTLIAEGKNPSWWGSDSELSEENKLTDLRLTVILLCAAINDEL